MFDRLFTLEYRRKRLWAKTPEGPLKDYLATPFADTRQDCRNVDFIAIDLETTGLDAKSDAIISFGFVGMHGTTIELSTAQHRIVRVDQLLSEENVVIHQLTDDAVARGEELRSVLGEVLAVMAGKVMIAHHARVEFHFISTACERLFGGKFLIPTVDTQWLAQQWYERRNKPFGGSELRLFNLREAYNLPRYNAHNALSDALAAGELFAAQLAERDTGHPLPLKNFLFRL